MPHLYPTPKNNFHGLALPATNAKAAVLVLPEWWGLTDYIKMRAREIADYGYAVLAADIYGQGVATTNPQQAMEWFAPLNDDRAEVLARVEFALAELQKISGLPMEKIAVLGFCFGGTLSLELARRGEKLAGCISLHGGLTFHDAPQPTGPYPPILVLNGADDPMIPFNDRQHFLAEMSHRGADVQFVDYSGAVHAFTNPDADLRRREYDIPALGYHAKNAARAMVAVKNFLAEILG
jgi:dienelactone hydrolase